MTNGRVEVITSVERRRRWSSAEKEQLVAASLEPGASVSSIAREAGIHPSCVPGRGSALRRCGSLRRLHPPVWPAAARSRSSSQAERGCGSRAQLTRSFARVPQSRDFTVQLG
jgi:transposase